MNTRSSTIGAVLFTCLFPALASAQAFADLRIEHFSVYSTLPERDGFRRVSVSFRVVNRGLSAAKASTTRVIFDNNATDFATPGLTGTVGLTQPEEAYITRSTRTT